MWPLPIGGKCNKSKKGLAPGDLGSHNREMVMHTPSLLLVNIAVTATFCISVGAVASRSRHDGLLYWAWALAAHALAYSLVSLRGQISDVVSIVVANGLLSVTFALFAEGLCQFQQRRVSHRLIWSPVVVLVVAYSFMLPYPEARVALSALIFTVQVTGILLHLFQKRRDTIGRGQYFVASGFVLVVLIFVFRAASMLSLQVDMALITDSNQVQAGTFLLSTISIVLIGLGLVLMTKELADERNRILALQDELTGLSNRRFIAETLTQHLAQAQRSQRALTLLMIDIDFFKRINDTFGHLSGDRALRGLADCIRGRLRAQDMAGRWGGEEFLVVLPDTDAQGAATLAEQLRQTVEQSRFESLDGRPMAFTISIGLHTLRTSGAEAVDDMIAAADQAMYQAKENGRNQVVQL